MKKTFIGWIGKTDSVNKALGHDKKFNIIDLNCVSKFKLNKNVWLPGEWPPTKVRITIEEVA